MDIPHGNASTYSVCLIVLQPILMLLIVFQEQGKEASFGTNE